MSDFSLGIPNHQNWPEKSLADISKVLRRGTAPSYVAASSVRAIGQRCVQDSGFQADKTRPHDPKLFGSSLVAEEGDVLVNSTGSGTIGRSCVFRAGGPFVVDSHITVIRPREGIDPEWINLMLRSPWGQRRLESHCFAGSTNQIELSRHQLALTTIPVPPWVVQRRISALLASLSDAERGLEASIAKLRGVRQGVLLAFMEKIVPEWKPVSEVGEVRMGKQLSPDSRAAGEQYPYLRVANVYAGHIDYSNVNYMSYSQAEREAYGLVPGDILLNEGQSLELVGRSAIYREAPGAFFFQNTLIRFRCGEQVMPEYAQIVFEYWLRVGVFAAIAKQTTSIAHLGGGRFGALEFPLVSLLGQQTLVASVASCDESMRAEADQLAKLRLLKRGLVDDLLTGRVAVSVAGG